MNVIFTPGSNIIFSDIAIRNKLLSSYLVHHASYYSPYVLINHNVSCHAKSPKVKSESIGTEQTPRRRYGRLFFVFEFQKIIS